MMRTSSNAVRFATSLLSFSLVLTSGAASAAGLEQRSDAALAARLDSIVTVAAREGFAGLVVARRGDREVFARGAGFANVAAKTPYAANTVVPIGSNVKDFTRAAIFRLVEDGKLALADSVGRFFPDAPSDKRAITVDQLLEHTAGLPLGVAPDSEPLAKAAFLARLWGQPLLAPPGEKERYSNAGYSLLAAIVEQVTGEAFDDHVARALLAPLGLKETGLVRPKFAPARLAHGYADGKDRGTMLDQPHDATGHLWALRGNGGYLATAADQFAWFRAIGEGRVVRDPALRARIFDPTQAGVFAGSDLVSAFLFAHFPREGVTLVVASNRAEHTAMRLFDRIAVALDLPTRRREDAAKPVVAVDLPAGGRWDVVRAWADAFRGGDEAALRRFFETHAVTGPEAPPIERRLDNARRMRGDLGRFTITGAREGADGPEIDVRGEDGIPASIGFEFEPGAAGKLRGLRVQVG